MVDCVIGDELIRDFVQQNHAVFYCPRRDTPFVSSLSNLNNVNHALLYTRSTVA